jgi:hypothetical protein
VASRAKEAKEIIRSRVNDFDHMSYQELHEYGERVEEVVSESGRRFRVETDAFWDVEPWQSSMYVQVKVRPIRGWRRWWAYKFFQDRGSPDE